MTLDATGSALFDEAPTGPIPAAHSPSRPFLDGWGIPYLGGFALGIPGLILGVAGVRNVKKGIASNNKVAIAGLLLSLFGIAISIGILGITALAR